MDDGERDKLTRRAGEVYDVAVHVSNLSSFTATEVGHTGTWIIRVTDHEGPVGKRVGIKVV